MELYAGLEFRVVLLLDLLPTKAEGPSLPYYLTYGREAMDSYHSQVCLHDREFNELDWNSNSSPPISRSYTICTSTTSPDRAHYTPRSLTGSWRIGSVLCFHLFLCSLQGCSANLMKPCTTGY